MQEYSAAKAELDGVLGKISAMLEYAAGGSDPDSLFAECGAGCAGCAGCSR
jgi:hypothetical protein